MYVTIYALQKPYIYMYIYHELCPPKNDICIYMYIYIHIYIYVYIYISRSMPAKTMPSKKMLHTYMYT